MNFDELKVGQKVWMRAGSERMEGTVHSFMQEGVVVDIVVPDSEGEFPFLFDKDGKMAYSALACFRMGIRQVPWRMARSRGP